jgi:acyl-coenzyme A thioesterase PaaI-like protein
MQNWPGVNISTQGDQTMCFGCGKNNPIGLKLNFTWDARTRTASAEFNPDVKLQGWAGFVHGGIIACILDEAFGWAAMWAGTNNVTARMQVRFRRMVPIGQKYIISCRIIKQNSRLIETEAKLNDLNGNLFSEGTSTQFVISQREEKAERHE